MSDDVDVVKDSETTVNSDNGTVKIASGENEDTHICNLVASGMTVKQARKKVKG